MIKIEIHDDLIDWLHNRLVLSTREECIEFAQEFVSFIMATGAVTIEMSDLLTERDALRAALKTLLPMITEYRKWLVDDAIARGDVLEGEAWDELDGQINQARAVLGAAEEAA